MMRKFRKFAATVALVGSLLATTTPAYAGGLFGDGGLIRGTVGEWVDEKFEHPITTPMARGTAVAGGAAIGTYYGGPGGGAAGACAGQMVNSMFAGQGPGNCMGAVLEQQARQYAQQYIPMGNICMTQSGPSNPGPMQPLGSGCMVNTPWGPQQGYIVQ